MARLTKHRHAGLRIDVSHGEDDGEHFAIPSLLGERYEITGWLAAGGFGAVFVARDRRIFDRLVLVKANRYSPHLFAHPHDAERDRIVAEQRARMQHEVAMLRIAQQREIAGTPVLIDLLYAPSPQLYGPHRSADGQDFVLDAQETMQEPYLVMGSIDGESLGRACARPRFREQLLKNTKTAAIQLCGILQAFHRYEHHDAGKLAFIYQDLKPENVIWTPTRCAYLIDFGSFAVRTPERVGGQNRFLCTPPYAPPEFSQSYSAEEAIVPSADIYSLGATLIHLLKGKIPWISHTGEVDLSLDASWPSAWRSWLQRATAEEPSERFESMFEMQRLAYQLPDNS